MKKFLKVVGILIGVVALLVAVLAIAVPILFPPAKAKALIEEKASAYLHRQVKLGAVSVGLFSGLSVSDFSLSESPDFSKGTFVSSEKFTLRPRLLPLLQKKIFIKDVILVRPHVTIVRLADGKTYNFSDLTASGAPKESSTSPAAFLVSKAVIENGELKFVDQSPSAQSITINALDLTVRNITPVSPVDAKASFSVLMKGTKLDVDFAGVVNLIKGAAKIAKLNVTSGDSKIDVTGEASQLTAAPTFDVNATFTKITPEFVSSFAPVPADYRWKTPINGTAHLKGTTASTALDSKITLGSFELNTTGKTTSVADVRRLDLKLATNAFLYKNLAANIRGLALPESVQLNSPLQLSTNLKGTTDDLTIENLKITTGGLVIDGKGKYLSKGTASSYDVDLKSASFPLEELGKIVPMLAEYGLTGKGAFAANITTGSKVKGVATLLGASAAFSGVKLSGIASSFDYLLSGSDVLKTTGELTAKDLKHENMTAANTNVKWNLANISGDLSHLNGNAALRMGAGAFQNIQKLTADVKVAKIVFMPITLVQKLGKAANGAVKVPSLDTVNFKEVIGDYLFKNGVMDITRFNLNGTDLNASMKGTVELAGQQKVDLRANLKLAAGMVGGTVGQILEDDQGRASLDMTVKGTVGTPSVSIELKDVGKKAVNVLKEKLNTPENKEKLDKLLKGLFK